MEAKSATLLYGGTDSERGAGGKLRQPPVRKSRATPYDRPSSNQQGRRWWLSKLVDPAYGLLASGAINILPALFSTTPSVAALPPPPENLDEQDVEVTPNAEGNERCTLNKTGQHLLPKHQNYEQLVTTSQDDFNFEPSKKPSLHSSAIKAKFASYFWLLARSYSICIF